MSETRYFSTACWQCDVPLVVPVYDQTKKERYYCQACAFSKIGA